MRNLVCPRGPASFSKVRKGLHGDCRKFNKNSTKTVWWTVQGEEEGGLMKTMNDWAKRKSDTIEDRKVFVRWRMSAMESCMIVRWVNIIATPFEHYKEGKHLQIHIIFCMSHTFAIDFLNRFTMWWGYNHPTSWGDLMDWNLDYFHTQRKRTWCVCIGEHT